MTIDIDATDVEVYGSKKRGVAYNYQGQLRHEVARDEWAVRKEDRLMVLAAG